MSRRARRSLQNLGVSLGRAAVGADLGGSSKYSNENFEGRRGERFHVNGTCTWPAHPGNDSVGGRVQRLEEHRTSRGVRCAPPAALENPEDRVPPTPGKGSRQNGSVTSGKGLALRAGHGGPSPEPVGCRRTARAASAARSGSPRAGRGTDWERLLRGPSPGVEQPTQNWYGQGESDCLIKTKHCDGPADANAM
ncbi:hypothetical protein L1887_53431 [Cichorium endivia]|nr:hypothetical protein L1887_53431 [Cichorium endivia]